MQRMAMQRMTLGLVALVVVFAPSMAFSQAQNEATIVSAEEIQKVVSAPGGGDREIKIVDMGKYNLGVAVLRRGATKPGAPVGAINHTKVTEVYYVVSGSGTLVTGGEIENIRPMAADNELVTTVVGPGNNATFKKPAQTRKLSAGDVVVIPAGVYHGFSEVPDHIEYVSVRPDLEKVLPAGYVNPALKK
jgi:mannose-6-phosphate isomerase-like protein (cupin superfamily)